MTTADQNEMMWPYEVADVFCVDPKTVTRWAERGRITSIRTPGGHRRYYRSEVRSYFPPDASKREEA